MSKVIDNSLIYVSVITRHHGDWAMFNAFQAAAGYAMSKGYKCMLAPHVGDSLVSRARNNALADFLETNAGWFFTLDDDIAMPQETLVKLIECNLPIVGGLYRLKKPYKKDDNIMGAIAFRGKANFVLGDSKPAEVQHISNGCVMHKRDFIEDMVCQYPELYYNENVSNKDRWALYQPFLYKHDNGMIEYLSEDWAFCQRAIDKGYKMYIRPDVLCDHWGLRNYSFKEMEETINA